jgi:hypothetical protein
VSFKVYKCKVKLQFKESEVCTPEEREKKQTDNERKKENSRILPSISFIYEKKYQRLGSSFDISYIRD